MLPKIEPFFRARPLGFIQDRAPGADRRRLGPHGFVLPSHELAPGTRAVLGRPQDCCPFIQIRILTGARHAGKASRSWSFVPAGEQPFRRGVTRTYAQACIAGAAWSHEWFATLTADQQNQVRQQFPVQPVPPEEAVHRGERRPADLDIGNDRQRQRVAA